MSEVTEQTDHPMSLKERVIDVLKTCYDPEIPVNIYEMGLVYEVREEPEKKIYLRMTLTSPNCPVAESLPREVEEKVREVEGVKDVQLDLVWEPPWSMEMLSEAAKLQLNIL